MAGDGSTESTLPCHAFAHEQKACMQGSLGEIS